MVSATLALAHDELASEKLERLAREENAEVDQALVLGAGPASRADRVRRHDGTLRQAARDVNVADSDTLLDPSYGCGSRGGRSRQIAAPDATLRQPVF